MDVTEMTKLSSNEDLLSKKGIESNRWDEIDFGLIQSLFKAIFLNISEKVSGTLTILTTIAISISDIVSDIVVALTLFSLDQYTLGIIVLGIDFIPC